jgi:hypothetical protein
VLPSAKGVDGDEGGRIDRSNGQQKVPAAPDRRALASREQIRATQEAKFTAAIERCSLRDQRPDLAPNVDF